MILLSRLSLHAPSGCEPRNGHLRSPNHLALKRCARQLRCLCLSERSEPDRIQSSGGKSAGGSEVVRALTAMSDSRRTGPHWLSQSPSLISFTPGSRCTPGWISGGCGRTTGCWATSVGSPFVGATGNSTFRRLQDRIRRTAGTAIQTKCRNVGTKSDEATFTSSTRNSPALLLFT